MNKIRITTKDQKEAQEIMKSIPPVTGEKRTVEKCVHCRQLFGRRFVPFGIGRGASYNLCLCHITQGNARSVYVLEAQP